MLVRFIYQHPSALICFLSDQFVHFIVLEEGQLKHTEYEET